MSKVYFTSDLHLNHDFVANTRGYFVAEEHDDHLMSQWNSVVTKRDSVWVLGDIGMGSLTAVLEKMSRLNGTKHLVLGNHDPGHPLHRGGYTKQRRYLEVFDSVQTAAQLRIDGQKVMLSHFPYHGDHKDTDRYTEWRLRDEGLPLLCGHVHSAWMFNGYQLNVGVDFAPKILSLENVTSWLNSLNEQPLERRN